MSQSRNFGNNLNKRRIGLINYDFEVDFEPKMTCYELEQLQEELCQKREEYERNNKRFISEEKYKLMWK